MSGGSKRSSKRTGGKAAKQRSIDRKLLTDAQKIAEEYSVILEPHGRLGYVGSSAEIPTVMVDARTPAACVKRVREALAVAVAVMLEQGQAPPPALGEGRRTEQINIRVTNREKTQLEQAARARGFRGLSDFIRATALSAMRRSA